MPTTLKTMSFAQWNAAAEEVTSSSGIDCLKYGLIFVGVIYLIILLGLFICLFLKCLEKLREPSRPSVDISAGIESASAAATATIEQQESHRVIVRIAHKIYEFVFYPRRNKSYPKSADGDTLNSKLLKIDIEPAESPSCQNDNLV